MIREASSIACTDSVIKKLTKLYFNLPTSLAYLSIILANKLQHISPKLNLCPGRSVERLVECFSTASAEMCVVPVLYDATKEFSFDKNVDYIIHGASHASPDLYTEKPVETMQGNIYGLTTLLEFSKDKQVERLLYVSSSEVYGDFSTDKPLLETNYGYVDILNPRSSYPMGKRAAETLCVSYLKEYGVESIIVRPGHIYGPSAKREDKRVSSAFVLNALKGEKIIMKSTGSQIRSYTYSLDCATAILQALLKEIREKHIISQILDQSLVLQKWQR